jgi:hypothetical protein
VATLRDLHQAIFPAARTNPPLDGPRGEREVTWVRVLKARVPAFEALDRGDLVIVPGTALGLVAPGMTEARDLAHAFVRAEVPAILLVEGDPPTASERYLEDSATEAGMTVLHLARADTVQLERSVIGFLVNRRAGLDRRASDLEAQLARLALHGRGLDVLAAAIAAFFGRAVVIEGRRGDPLAIHAPAGVQSASLAVTRYLARPADAALRLTIPAPPGESESGGRLVLLGEEPVGELEEIASERIAAILALELARDAAVRHARDEVRRGDPLPADGPPWVVIVARQAPAERPDDVAAREETRAELRLLASARRVTLRGTSESLELRLIAAAPADDPGGVVIAGRVADFLRRTVAVSRPFDEPGGRPSAEAAARATLEAAELLDDPPRVALAARLAGYILLGNLRNLPDGLRQARTLLAPILTGRRPAQDERLATLRAVLEGDGLASAAARLGVHRNTVAYRVRRLEETGHWDLDDPDLRLALLIATRIVQREQNRSKE